MTEEVRLSRRVVVELGGALRGMATNATSMEEAAGRMVRHMYDRLRDPQTQQPLCALVRLFKTHRYQYLPHSLQVFAQHMAGGQPIAAETRCLTLLATAGDVPAWNSRETSVGHQAIPLTSEEMVKQSPMIAQLLHQFGLDPRDVISPETDSMQHTRTDTYGIFHVARAAESDYVPAQDAFVQPYGIASVLGFGGPLTAGDLFAMILFCKSPLSMETASEFPSIALSAKLALLSLTEAPLFALCQPEDR
jgi:hypothetical protein